MIHVIAFFIPLFYVFLKVVQMRNISHSQEILMFITSYGITAFEILSITYIVSKGWTIYWSLATGGAIGCIAATRFHKKFMKGKSDAKLD